MISFTNLFVVCHLKPLKWFKSITFTEGEEEDSHSTSVSRYEFISELRTLCETAHVPPWEDKDARLLFDFILNPVCGNNHFSSLFVSTSKTRERRMHQAHFRGALRIFNLSTKRVNNLNAISKIVLKLGEHASSHGLKIPLLLGDRSLKQSSMLTKENLSYLITTLVTDFIRSSKNNQAQSWLLQVP
jgi:hypothetical protein